MEDGVKKKASGPGKEMKDSLVETALDQEHELLATVLRQNRNQHRAAKFFQKFIEILRTLAKQRQAWRQFTTPQKPSSSTPSTTTTTSPPSPNADIINVLRSTHKLFLVTYHNSRFALQLIQQTYFMPFATVILAIAARLHVLSKQALLHLIASDAVRASEDNDVQTLVAASQRLLPGAQDDEKKSRGKRKKKRTRKQKNFQPEDFGVVLSRELVEVTAPAPPHTELDSDAAKKSEEVVATDASTPIVASGKVPSSRTQSSKKNAFDLSWLTSGDDDQKGKKKKGKKKKKKKKKRKRDETELKSELKAAAKKKSPSTDALQGLMDAIFHTPH